MPSPSRVRWSVSTSERTISGAESSKMGRSPEKLVARHGLPTISLHKLRYLPASLQIAAGVDTAIVSKRLRHSSIKITNDTYGHMIPAQNTWGGRDSNPRPRDYESPALTC